MGIFNKRLSKIASRISYPMLQPTRRSLHFHLPADRISDWHNQGGKIFTAFLNTFSIVLPVGERFFIDSVRAHRDLVHDPELQKAVTAFIGQEAMHGREHELYNEALAARTDVVERFETLVSKTFDVLKKIFPETMWLSGTIALEHFTALLAHALLSDPKLFEGAEPHFHAVWHWHALEETEHKAVAYDVWEAVMGRGVNAYAQRSLGLILATVIFWAYVIPHFLMLVKQEKLLTSWKDWKLFYRYAFGEIGALRKMLLPYLDYFRPNYHPWDHDNRQYLKELDNIYQALGLDEALLRKA